MATPLSSVLEKKSLKKMIINWPPNSPWKKNTKGHPIFLGIGELGNHPILLNSPKK